MDMSVVHGTVVVGVDGSEPAEAALGWAVREAALEGGALSVVHACGVPGMMEDFADIVAHERGLRSVGRSIAREAVQAARLADPTIGVESVVTMGHPDTVLVEASETARLVVVGARGRGTVASALLGSVSATLARESHCPVVVVRRLPGAADADQLPVVVGVDGTPASTSAVELGFKMASTHGVPLTLLHATWDLRERASALADVRSYADRVNLSEEEERLVAETVAGLGEKYPDVAVTEVYRSGEPVRRLVEASRDASVVVVGSRGRRLMTTTLLGSVSRGVAERAYCPVAVVRP
jgi:nucleotide-binding universal stress UspA family protein